MNSTKFILFLSSLAVSFSLAFSLKCISCSQNLVVILNSPSSYVPCQNRTEGNSIPCDDKVCSLIYHGNKTVERGCSEADVCENLESGTCGTCTTDLCIPGQFDNSAGHKESIFSAALVMGIIFIIFGR